jgi:CBS domain-containing protein
MALILDNGTLVGVIERADLTTATTDEASAQEIARLYGCTIRPDAALADARAQMTRDGRRLLAVTTEESALAGLLCLKASGHGCCSDEDVAARRQKRHSRMSGHRRPDQSASSSSMTTRARSSSTRAPSPSAASSLRSLSSRASSPNADACIAASQWSNSARRCVAAARR